MEQITLRYPSKAKQSYYPGSKGWNNHYQSYRHEAFGESGVEKTTYKTPLEKTKYSGYVKASGLPTFAYKIPDGKIWKSAPYADRIPRGGSVPRIIGTSSEGGTPASTNEMSTQTVGTSTGTQTQQMEGTPVVTGVPTGTQTRQNGVGMETQTPGQTVTTAGTQTETPKVPEPLPDYQKPPTPKLEIPPLSPDTIARYKNLTPFLGRDVSKLPSPTSSMGSLVNTPVDNPMDIDGYTTPRSLSSSEIPQEQTTYAGNIQSILMEPPQVQNYLKERADTDPQTAPTNIPYKVWEMTKNTAKRIVSGISEEMPESKKAPIYHEETPISHKIIGSGVHAVDRVSDLLQNTATGAVKYVVKGGTGTFASGMARALNEGARILSEKKEQVLKQEPEKKEKQEPEKKDKGKQKMTELKVDTSASRLLRSQGPVEPNKVTIKNYKNLKVYQLKRVLNLMGVSYDTKVYKTKSDLQGLVHEWFLKHKGQSIEMHVTP